MLNINHADLPPEIWHEVFSLCCADGSQNGRSLSLVSRKFNQLSAPYKYRSISANSGCQIVLLSRTLERLPPNSRRVLHLFLGVMQELIEEDLIEECGEDDGQNVDDNQPRVVSLAQNFPLLVENNSGRRMRISTDAVVEAIQSTLLLCSGTLITLALTLLPLPFVSPVYPNPPCVFPRLVELTLLAHDIPYIWNADDILSTLVFYPVLKRLRLNDILDRRDIQLISHIAPKIEYLRAPFNFTSLLTPINGASDLLPRLLKEYHIDAPESVWETSGGAIASHGKDLVENKRIKLIVSCSQDPDLLSIWLGRQIGLDVGWN